MQRNEWTFQYLAREIGAASTQKREHHESRLTFWRDELVKAEAALREKGVEFREAPMTSSYGATHRTDVVIDPTLQSRVSECRGKVQTHESQAYEFARWERTFDKAHADAPAKVYDLNADDLAYFGIADGELAA
jgi:hypothetical protein